MKNKIFIIGLILSIIFSSNIFSQVYIKKLDGTKTIQINKNNKIKLVQITEKKFNGIYGFLRNGKNKKYIRGKMINYNDSIIVVSYIKGFKKKADTIKIAKIYAINKSKPYIEMITTASGAVSLVLAVGAVFSEAPVILAYGIVLGWSIINDIIVYPVKKLNKQKWELIVKN